jgi:hypothetical protein
MYEHHSIASKSTKILNYVGFHIYLSKRPFFNTRYDGFCVEWGEMAVGGHKMRLEGNMYGEVANHY